MLVNVYMSLSLSLYICIYTHSRSSMTVPHGAEGRTFDESKILTKTPKLDAQQASGTI